MVELYKMGMFEQVLITFPTNSYFYYIAGGHFVRHLEYLSLSEILRI